MANLREKLERAFIRFPGIGPRQARRFVYHLLGQTDAALKDLAINISQLKKEVGQCPTCYRYFDRRNRDDSPTPCDLCLDPKRDNSLLMILEKDADLEIVRKSDHYQGKFFILGGLLPILEPEPETKIRSRELLELIKGRPDWREVIIALATNLEGDNTTAYLQKLLQPHSSSFKLTVLGRGLSTGTELEYSDSETIKNALKNRS